MLVGSEYELVGEVSLIAGRRFMRQPQYSLIEQPAKKPVAKRVAKVMAGIFVLMAVGSLASPGNIGFNKAAMQPATKAVTSIDATKAQAGQPVVQPEQKLTPEDCDLKDVPYATTSVNEPTEPAGQKVSLPQGVKGLDKVCYVNGRSQAPTISHVSMPVNEVVHVGTYVQPAPVPTPLTAYSACSGYINVDGNCIPSPSATGGTQGGYSPTYTCRDGTFSYAQHRQGACSHHGGVL